MKYIERAAPPPGDDPMEFVLSDDSIDRVGDVVEQNWELADFARNPIALFHHDRDAIVGRWADVRVVKNQLLGKLELARAGTSAIVDTVRALIEQRILRGVSVGFQPVKKIRLTETASEFWGPFRFLKSKLLEVSLVSIPANPNALAVARSMNLPPDMIGRVFSKPAVDAPIILAVHGKPAKPMQVNGKGSAMTLSERIETLQNEFNARRDRLNDILANDTPTEEQQAQADEIGKEIEQIKTQLQKYRAYEKAMAPLGSTALTTTPQHAQAPVEPSNSKSVEILEPPRRPFAMPKKQLDNLDYCFRALSAWASSIGAHEPAEKILRERYGNDEITGMTLRAAVNPAMTTVAGWALELTTIQTAGFLDRTLPDAIFTVMSGLGVRYSFGNSATIKIPTRTTSNTVAGNWVGEGAPKPVRRLSFSSITLTPYKLAVISTFTEEMALYSNPAIEGIIRQAMQDDTRIALDTYLIDAVASSSVRPAGLLNGVTPLTATASGTAAEKMVADLKQLYAAIVAAGGGSNVVVLLNPAQALSLGLVQTTTGDFLFAGQTEAGNRFSVRFIKSLTVPAGRVIAIDAAEFATALGDAPRFAISNEATLHEEDTTPLAIGTVGAPASVAAPARSLFQTDSVAIRLTLYVTWAMRRTGMVQTIAAVGW